MKILHITDLHFNKSWFEWIADEQDNCDVCCLSGDFLDSSKNETLQVQISWITKWFKEFKKPLFVCSGNHDIEDFDNEDWLSKVESIYSDNAIATIKGVKIGCVPFLAPDFYEFSECDILLYHLPPSDTKTATHKITQDDWGDKELYRLLNNGTLSPKALLCGHMHHPKSSIEKFKTTTIYNPGSDKKSKTPKHNIIEM